MPTWNYDDDSYQSQSEVKLIPVGTHRVRIEEVEEMRSKSGKDMFKISIKVSGFSTILYYYLLFDEDNRDMTNKKLGDVYASFNIPKGNLSISEWRGKVGAAMIAHEEYNQKTYSKVNYFVTKARAEESDLPPWKEVKSAEPKEKVYTPF
jgi:hypothetical protein